MCYWLTVPPAPLRFEPGQTREMRLVPYSGAQRVFELNGQVVEHFEWALLHKPR